MRAVRQGVVERRRKVRAEVARAGRKARTAREIGELLYRPWSRPRCRSGRYVGEAAGPNGAGPEGAAVNCMGLKRGRAHGVWLVEGGL